MKWQRVEPKDLRGDSKGSGNALGIQAQPRWGQSVVAFHQKLIFFGGWNGKFCFNDVQVVDFGSSSVYILWNGDWLEIQCTFSLHILIGNIP